MTLSPTLGVVGISTLWHFKLPLAIEMFIRDWNALPGLLLLIQMFIKVASSPRLSGTGMPSPILWSHPLKMQRIVLLSSLLWWELGTNSLITGPGEWLSFRRFTSKLSWSWQNECAPSEDSDQPGQPPLILLVLSCPGSNINFQNVKYYKIACLHFCDVFN